MSRFAQLSSMPSTRPKVAIAFLQLPPSYRSFHASPRPQFIIETSIVAAQSLFEGVHSVSGLPWAYSIPLTAIMLRASTVLPMGIYSRHILQKQATLSPLLSAWQTPLRKETMQEVAHLGAAVSHRRLLEKTRKKTSEIYKTFNCQRWKAFLPSMVQIPVWLTAVEALRRMCGTHDGLLGMAVRIFSSDESTLTSDGTEASRFIEQSFADEGALWFSNLLIADPQMYLPFIFSACVLANILTTRGGNTVWQRRVKRSLGLVALAIGPLTLHVPSAMLVYWITSASAGLMQATLLDWLMPAKPSTVPCKPRKSATIPGGV